MIKGVYPTGRYVAVTGGTTTQAHIYTTNTTSTGAQVFAGQVRYSTTSQGLEIFDGSAWQVWYTGVASVGLTPDAEQIMDWARDKMMEEQRWAEKAADNPTLADALENLRRAQEQVTIIEKLIQ